MLTTKIDYLKKCGKIHFFNIDGSNFVYNREHNYTYQIDDSTYECLNAKSDSEIADNKFVDKFLCYDLKKDVKPLIGFYSVYIRKGQGLTTSATETLKEYIYSYAQTEVIHDVSDDSTNEDYFLENVSHFQGMNRSDLVIIRERQLSPSKSVDEHSYTDNSLIKVVHKISCDEHINISNLPQGTGQVKCEYRFDQTSQILDILRKSTRNINFYINDEKEVESFFAFLTAIFKNEPELGNRVYNIYSIANFLVSNLNFSRSIEFYNDGVLLSSNSLECNQCWARNICHVTKSFEAFGIDLLNEKNNSLTCNSIRALIQFVILKLRSVEKNKANKPSQADYEFDEFKIKLIN